MIYILKKSKMTKEEEKMTFTFNEAKFFLEGLNYNSFKTNEYYLLGADTPDVMRNLMKQFRDDFFIKEEDDVFERYRINHKVNKRERLVIDGAKTKSIVRFSEKIQQEIGATSYELNFNPDNFNLTLNKPEETLMLTCSYELEILHAFAYDELKRLKVDIERAKSYVVLANEVLRRQRSYYKKGKLK